MNWRWICCNDQGLRSGWRILIYALLFQLLLFAFAPLAGVELGEGPAALTWQWVPILAAAVTAGWIILVALERRPPGALGFAWYRGVPRELGAGVAIGALSLGAVVVFFFLAGWVTYHPEGGSPGEYLGTLAGGFVFFLVAAAAEEAIFRGYPFQALVQGIGAIPATLVSSLAFAAAHALNPNVDLFALLNIFLAGIMLSAAYLRTRSLWFATAVHLGWNWSMASLFDLPVSGWTAVDTPYYEPVLSGPEWFTGGAFGPEGGLGGSIAFVIALLAVSYLPGLGAAPEMTALRPLVDDRLRGARLFGVQDPPDRADNKD